MDNQHDQLSSQAIDFANCDWQRIVTTLKEPGYSALVNAFREAACSTKSKALCLLADVCALHLRPESKNDPFRSTILNPNLYTINLDSFSDEERNFIADVAKATDHSWLKARLADLLWIVVPRKALVRSKKRHEWAWLAIESYRNIPFTDEAWLNGAATCWERVVTLVVGPGREKAKLEEAIIEQLLQVFRTRAKATWRIAYDIANQLNRIDLPEAVHWKSPLSCMN